MAKRPHTRRQVYQFCAVTTTKKIKSNLVFGGLVCSSASLLTWPIIHFCRLCSIMADGQIRIFGSLFEPLGWVLVARPDRIRKFCSLLNTVRQIRVAQTFLLLLRDLSRWALMSRLGGFSATRKMTLLVWSQKYHQLTVWCAKPTAMSTLDILQGFRLCSFESP